MLHIPVRREECVGHLQTTPLTLVDVLLVGKVRVYVPGIVCPVQFVVIQNAIPVCKIALNMI